MAARHQREHQRAAPPVLPERNRPRETHRRGSRGRRRHAQQPAAEDAWLADTGRGPQRAPGGFGMTSWAAARTRLSPLRHSLRSRLRNDSRVTPYSHSTYTLLRGPVEPKLHAAVGVNNQPVAVLA